MAYQAGNFGLPKKTEDITKISYIKKAKKLAKNDKEPVAPVFIDESQTQNDKSNLYNKSRFLSI